MPRLPLLSVPRSRTALSVCAALALTGISQTALAECPPGAWFCADAAPDAKDEKPAGDVKEKVETKADAKDGPKEIIKKVEPGESTQVPNGGNTTIIVQAAPPPPQQPPPAATPVAPPPRVVAAPKPVHRYQPPPRRRNQTEWGFNMHLQSAMMESEKQKGADGAGMGGLGFSLRARPTGHFAVDFGLDFLGGRDFNGNRRSEVPFTINAMLFVNPRNRAQLYFLGGMGWSAAHVEMPDGNIAKYSYFGLQTGVGLEYRATRSVGLNVDLLGFVRGRTDKAAASNPEFVDPATGRSTNTSGGGLLRGGLTVYW
jgi:hypothetical protein